MFILAKLKIIRCENWGAVIYWKLIDKLVPVKEFEDDGHEVYGMKISYKKLWKQLIDEDMMKKDLQQKAGISWATMTKMSKGEVVSTEVLMKVCQVLHCNVGDIIDFIEDDPE